MISVCMATYNGEIYIKDQLESILIQLGEGDEIIVSDDGSTDETLKIVNSLFDLRIKIFKNYGRKGYTGNFENALSRASGDYVFLADQDDVWLPGKVKKYMEVFSRFDFIVSDNVIVDAELSILKESHFEQFGTGSGFVRNLIYPRYVGACMAFNRKVLDKALPFPINSDLCAHDYWISLVSELHFRVHKIDEPFLLYRRHGSNASTGGLKSQNTLVHKLLVRLYVLSQLIGRLLK